MTMRKGLAPLVALLLASAPLPLAAQQPTPQETAIVQSLHPQHGRIAIPAAKASLDLGEAYDFYGPEDAKNILVNLWGNPPESAANTLGLVMPAGASPLSDTWGAVVTYEDTGYVSDEDAADTDYNDLLGQMREGESEANEQRKQAGYPAIHLAGWAQQPQYDKKTHSVVWARDLEFSGQPVHTLNYDVRTLGRSGVLSLNLISSMPQLGSISTAARDFTAHAAFDPGSRYEDFDASSDRKAEYGIGGLIAAGVGVAAAKKLGILALFAKFLKPLLIGLVAAFAVLRKKIVGLFTRNKDPLEG
jgi:uncharacterized membrane-anchored protein